jgi:hypothetical protein
VWYEALSHSYLAFVASLQLLSVPTNWDYHNRLESTTTWSKWGSVMREELEALRKNETWELTPSNREEGGKL